MAKKQSQTEQSPRIANRKARYEYEILEKFEVGIVRWPAVRSKSIRNAQASLAEGFAKVEPDPTPQLYLYNVDIAPYPHAAGYHAFPNANGGASYWLTNARYSNSWALTTQGGTTLVPLGHVLCTRQR